MKVNCVSEKIQHSRCECIEGNNAEDQHEHCKHGDRGLVLVLSHGLNPHEQLQHDDVYFVAQFYEKRIQFVFSKTGLLCESQC